MDFLFKGKKIEDIDLPRIGHAIGVGEDVIHAVLDTETTGRSTDSKGRIAALYEPHVAYRNSSGAVRKKLVEAGLAYAKWKKGYPKDSYPRILKAMEIDREIALRATSWGFPQLLGENFALAGYESAVAMVKHFLLDEDNQIEAMIAFIKNAGLDDELRVIEAKLDRKLKITADDARPFVRGYNGSAYAKNGYHTKFAAAANKWAGIKDTAFDPEIDLTDEELKLDRTLYTDVKTVKMVQETLNRLNYNVGGVDGKLGPLTKAAILAFRNDNQTLPLDDAIDDAFLSALLIAKPRELAPARTEATPAVVTEKVPEAKAHWWNKIIAAVSGGAALIGGATDFIAPATGALDPLRTIAADVPGYVWFGLAGIVAVSLFLIARRGEQKSVEAFQTGARL